MTYKKWQKDQLWNNSQSTRNKHLHLFRVKMYCRVFTSVLIVLVFASFSPVLFEHLGLQLFLFDNAWCGAILPLVWFLFFFCPFICNSLSYNSEQDSESWLANRSVLMACNAPFSVFFTHWWHLFSSAMFYKHSQSFLTLH